MPSLNLRVHNVSVPGISKGRDIMETAMILKIISLGLLHWILVPIALTNLIERQRVLGRMKLLWVPAIVLFTCFGPLAYLIIHELMPQPQTQVDYDESR